MNARIETDETDEDVGTRLRAKMAASMVEALKQGSRDPQCRARFLAELPRLAGKLRATTRPFGDEFLFTLVKFKECVFLRDWPLCFEDPVDGLYLPLNYYRRPLGLLPPWSADDVKVYAHRGWKLRTDPIRFGISGNGNGELYDESTMRGVADFEAYLVRLANVLGTADDNTMLYAIPLLQSLPE